MVGLFSLTACESDSDVKNLNQSLNSQSLESTKLFLSDYMTNFYNDYTMLTNIKGNTSADINQQMDEILLNRYSPKFLTKNDLDGSYYNDWNNNILITYKDNLDGILSKDAINLLLSFVANGKNSKDALTKLKEEINCLENSDKEVLNQILIVSDLFYNSLQFSDTKAALTGTPCNVMYSVMGTVTGAIWGAAFGGPVGFVVAAAWGVATTLLAEEEC